MTFPESPEAFGASLKAERVRQGLSLATISQTTKITESHFVALERGDLRNWPKGIFRRAFFSDYLRALGLPLEPALTVFARVFPDGTTPVTAAPVAAAQVIAEPVEAVPQFASELRLSLAPSPLIAPGAIPRARIAALDALLVVLAGAAVSRVATAPVGFGLTLAALLYYSIVTVLGTESPAARLLAWAHHPIWPALPRFQAPGPLGQLAIGRRVKGWVSALSQRSRRIDVSGVSRVAREFAAATQATIARAAAPVREPRGAHDEWERGDDEGTVRARTGRGTDHLSRTEPQREEGSLPRQERRLSKRPARERSESPSLRVRIRLTR